MNRLQIVDDIPMHKLSFDQCIRWWIYGAKTEYPIHCALCGEKVKGNWLIGYRMSCCLHVKTK